MYAYGSNTELKKKDVINFLTDLIKKINNDDIIVDNIGTTMINATERNFPIRTSFSYHWVSGELPIIGRFQKEEGERK